MNLQKRRASQKMSDAYDTFDRENDFIDEYLTKVDNCRNRKSSFFGDKGVVNLQRSLTDLFGAGSETTTTEILFCFLYMIKFPEIQVRKYELQNVKIATLNLNFFYLFSNR